MKAQKAILRKDGIIFRYNPQLLRYPEFRVIYVDEKMKPIKTTKKEEKTEKK